VNESGVGSTEPPKGEGAGFAGAGAGEVFAPDSAIRRIGGEAVLMLGGGRALLMQAAHPLVAAGIVGHSRYADEPWRRLARTMLALYTVVHGTKADAERMSRRVRAVHAGVRGRLAAPLGSFAAGSAYSALDPKLQLWVHSTLVDTGLVMHETFVARLAPVEQEAFYAQMKVVARVFGVPARIIPRTLADFRAYQESCLDGGEVRVTDAARAVAATVLDPPVPLALRPAVRVLNLATVGLLPRELREQYELPWGRAREGLLRSSAAAVRRGLPLVPSQVRLLDPEDLSRRRKARPLGLLAAFAR
jgi:uncharacterized protein (DUF2236 family)